MWHTFFAIGYMCTYIVATLVPARVVLSRRQRLTRRGLHIHRTPATARLFRGSTGAVLATFTLVRTAPVAAPGKKAHVALEEVNEDCVVGRGLQFPLESSDALAPYFKVVLGVPCVRRDEETNRPINTPLPVDSTGKLFTLTLSPLYRQGGSHWLHDGRRHPRQHVRGVAWSAAVGPAVGPAPRLARKIGRDTGEVGNLSHSNIVCSACVRHSPAATATARTPASA